ncbi:TPA: hypothetical protein DDX46_00880 [Candidatus Saccharibacteria bacterium]|nr:MAG: exported protein of unknown function [Candidatus Saccharibacteria bacterium GW2011_GWC2_44_17]OGL33476.1 MAG: hypothetical protein A3E20_01670 [Candidatus Saccharibacteria bacterium RIFCSPHIGHO2_12_FULL_47_16]HBH77287.1 hypothetical protein [Candidatus Saccharibacteria bacterium]
MLVSLKRNDRGDTIVEVLFAVTIFAMLAVGALSIMNQGLGIAQRALEINLVRQQIDAQTDALRYLNQAYVADYGKEITSGSPTDLWNKLIVKNTVRSAVSYDTMVTGTQCREMKNNLSGDVSADDTNAFALDVTKLDNPAGDALLALSPATTYAKVRYGAPQSTAEGISIQAVKSNADNDFYDFHIRACWASPGQAQPVLIGTIVRLYEPRG